MKLVYKWTYTISYSYTIGYILGVLEEELQNSLVTNWKEKNLCLRKYMHCIALQLCFANLSFYEKDVEGTLFRSIQNVCTLCNQILYKLNSTSVVCFQTLANAYTVTEAHNFGINL